MDQALCDRHRFNLRPEITAALGSAVAASGPFMQPPLFAHGKIYGNLKPLIFFFNVMD
jgi:hypothetical protein